MANRVVNLGIEFAYASEHIEQELKRELEKYFTYQNVVVIDNSYNFCSVYDKLEKTVKCQLSKYKSIDNIETFENIDCIIAVDFFEIDKIKIVCKEKTIPYIIVLTQVADVSVFKKYAFDNTFKKMDCNFPLGIVFDLGNTYNKKELISQIVLEVSSISFDISQKKIENLFFGKQIDYDYLSGQKNILEQLQQVLENRCENIDLFLKKIADLYLSYVIVCAKDDFCVLDNLMVLYKLQNKKMIIESKYLFRQIITSLEKNSFEYYTKNFKDTINYKLHEKYLSQINISFDTNFFTLPESKVNFLLLEFKEKLLENVNINISFDKFIKSILADIDVDYLYQMLFRFKHSSLSNYICIEPDIFKTPNFLNILYQLGLLNFQF